MRDILNIDLLSIKGGKDKNEDEEESKIRFKPYP